MTESTRVFIVNALNAAHCAAEDNHYRASRGLANLDRLTPYGYSGMTCGQILDGAAAELRNATEARDEFNQLFPEATPT